MGIFDEGGHGRRVVSFYEGIELCFRYVGDLFGAPLCCARYAELLGDLPAR